MKSLLIKVYLVINKDINNIYLYKEFDYNFTDNYIMYQGYNDNF